MNSVYTNRFISCKLFSTIDFAKRGDLLSMLTNGNICENETDFISEWSLLSMKALSVPNCSPYRFLDHLSRSSLNNLA